MSINQINYLNIFFMLISAWFAVILPFETFLFSYAILGPLHYLTEINWLHSKKYFLSKTQNLGFYLILLFIIFGLSINTIFAVDFYTHYFSFLEKNDYYNQLKILNFSYIQGYLFIALSTALGWVFFEKLLFKWIWIFTSISVGILFYNFNFESFLAWFVLFLPTIIHVWLFTGIFILAGAFKSNVSSGWISFIFFIGISIGLFFINKNVYAYHPSGYTKESFNGSNFQLINGTIYQLFFNQNMDIPFSLNSKIGLKIQSLIAFAYTYHYLNWFSKTSIIKWHEVSKLNLSVTIIFWILSILLYCYNYKTGLAALYFLSVLHVILEFPLNAFVIKQIFMPLKKIIQ